MAIHYSATILAKDDGTVLASYRSFNETDARNWLKSKNVDPETECASLDKVEPLRI